MREVSIAVLGKYPDIFAGFKENADLYLRGHQKILVRDGLDIQNPGDEWTVIQGPNRFSMAGNANMSWRACNQNNDVLYVGDDVRFKTVDDVALLREAAYSQERVGIASPIIEGHASNTMQLDQSLDQVRETCETLAFVCVYLRRDMLNEVGLLDENFREYGYDDDDYCRRATKNGWKLVVTPKVWVIHQGGCSATFKRNHELNPGSWSMDSNREHYKRKWGIT